MDAGILIPLIKSNYFYRDIAGNIKKWFDTKIYDERRRKRSSLVRKI